MGKGDILCRVVLLGLVVLMAKSTPEVGGSLSGELSGKKQEVGVARGDRFQGLSFIHEGKKGNSRWPAVQSGRTAWDGNAHSVCFNSHRGLARFQLKYAEKTQMKCI